MTRPPTLSALKAEARRVFGPDPFVYVDRYAKGEWMAEASGNGELITRVTGTEAEARRMLMTCLRALPSHAAPAPKKKRGRK